MHSVTSVNCHKCDKSFPSQRLLFQHVASMHNSAVTPHDCHICHKNFPSQRLMLQHVSVVHSSVPAFVTPTATGGTVAYCSTCDKTFSSPMDLKQHVDMTHTRNCSFCGVKSLMGPNSFSKKNPYNFCDNCNKKLNPVVSIEEISDIIPKGATTIYNVGELVKKDKKFQKRPAKVSLQLVITQCSKKREKTR